MLAYLGLYITITKGMFLCHRLIDHLNLRPSIVNCKVFEERSHRFIVVDASNRLTKQQRDVNRFDLLAIPFLLLMRHCVGDNDLEITLIKSKYG